MFRHEEHTRSDGVTMMVKPDEDTTMADLTIDLLEEWLRGKTGLVLLIFLLDGVRTKDVDKHHLERLLMTVGLTLRARVTLTTYVGGLRVRGRWLRLPHQHDYFVQLDGGMHTELNVFLITDEAIPLGAAATVRNKQTAQNTQD